MQDASQAGDKRTVVSTRTMEIVVAVLFLVVGAIVMMDSLRIGAGWIDPDGPQAGYFPMRMGVIMSLASVVVLVQAVMARGPGRPFVDRPRAEAGPAGSASGRGVMSRPSPSSACTCRPPSISPPS